MKKLIHFSIVALLLIGLTSCGNKTEVAEEQKELSIFIGEPLADYPEEGTRIGNLIQEQTGIHVNFEFLVGELETKAGIMLAGGDLPDIINARKEQRKFYDQGYLVPLEDLMSDYAPNLMALYGPYLDRLREEDGHVYILPDLVPIGDASYTNADKGWWIQKRVLAWDNYPMIKTLDDYFDLISRYLEAFPETNGQSNIGFEPLTFSWYKDYLYSGCNVLSGYSGEGQGFVNYENGEWIFKNYFGSAEEERYYRILNNAFREGLIDPEGFVGTLDDYKAKLAGGNVLGIYDEAWIMQESQNILKAEMPENIYVAFPVTFDGIPDQYHPALSLAVGLGSSITTSCDDPIVAIQYLDYLATEEAQRYIYWGEEGTDYIVTEGRFSRTDEMRQRFEDNDFIQKEFGGEYYYEYLPGRTGKFTDGNTIRPGNQPEEFVAKVSDTEKEVLEAYGISTFYEMFTPPDSQADRTVYQPLWSMQAEQGSDFDIINTKITRIRDLFCSKMILAGSASEFNSLWDSYLTELSAIDLDVYENFYQENIDSRVKNALHQ